MTLTLEVGFEIGGVSERFATGDACPAVISRDFGQMFFSCIMLLEFAVADEVVVTEIAVTGLVLVGEIELRYSPILFFSLNSFRK